MTDISPNLEYDLLKVDWIRQKCLVNNTYAQNLYAALCNNRFFKDGKEWTCSWRYAGGIVADLRSTEEIPSRQGDYMDWYCSGTAAGINGYVSEGEVTSEITNDLLNLGWTHKPYEPRLNPGLYINNWGRNENIQDS